MSRISEKPCVGPLDPWKNISTGVPNTVFAANPATGAQPSSGSGVFDPNVDTLVGQRFDTNDGRELVFVRNGAVALAAGVLVQSAAETTAHQKLAMTVPTATPATAGLFQVLVTNGATVVKQNIYAGGYLIVASGTGIGQMLRISSHQAAAASATFIVTTADPIQTTLDATSKISLLANPYADVIISPSSTATGGPVGITLYGIPTSTAPTWDGTSGALTTNGTAQYGLLVSHGPATCLIDSTVTNVGYPLGVSKTTAGTLGVATLTTVPQIAVSGQTLTSANNGLVMLML